MKKSILFCGLLASFASVSAISAETPISGSVTYTDYISSSSTVNGTTSYKTEKINSGKAIFRKTDGSCVLSIRKLVDINNVTSGAMTVELPERSLIETAIDCPKTLPDGLFMKKDKTCYQMDLEFLSFRTVRIGKDEIQLPVTRLFENNVGCKK
jgi:hypothetical protein